MTRLETVLIIHKASKILLGVKKRKLGAGRYNGYGGGVEPTDKDIYDTAIRETQEEIGVTPINPELKGSIYFRFTSSESDRDVHFFKAKDYEGIPNETDEMTAEWFDDDNIPYKQMWASDAIWLPILLSGKWFTGELLYDSSHNIIKHNITQYDDVKSFESALNEMN